jgi:hypothetical protein
LAIEFLMGFFLSVAQLLGSMSRILILRHLANIPIAMIILYAFQKKVVLSKIDKTFDDEGKLKWIDTDPKAWYTPSDYCIVQNWKQGKEYGDVTKLCNVPSDMETKAAPLGNHITLGSSDGKGVCSIESRPYFKKALSGFKSPKSPDLLNALKYAYQHRQCLIFFGDSVTRQSYYAFLAEVTRIDKSVSFRRYLRRSDVPVGRYSSTFLRGDFGEGDKYGGMASLYLDKDNKNESTVWFHHFSSADEIGTGEKFLDGFKDVGCNGLIILANIGLHINDESTGKTEFRKALRLLNDFAKDPKNTIIWRETTAQHFPYRDDGIFDEKYKHRYTSCQAHRDSSPTWRVTQVQDVWKELNIQNISYVPFYKATEPLYRMHAGLPTKHLVVDCTHYCVFPMMWQPLWSGLATAIVSNRQH